MVPPVVMFGLIIEGKGTGPPSEKNAGLDPALSVTVPEPFRMVGAMLFKRIWSHVTFVVPTVGVPVDPLARKTARSPPPGAPPPTQLAPLVTSLSTPPSHSISTA